MFLNGVGFDFGSPRLKQLRWLANCRNCNYFVKIALELLDSFKTVIIISGRRFPLFLSVKFMSDTQVCSTLHPLPASLLGNGVELMKPGQGFELRSFTSIHSMPIISYEERCTTSDNLNSSHSMMRNCFACIQAMRKSPKLFLWVWSSTQARIYANLGRGHVNLLCASPHSSTYHKTK